MATKKSGMTIVFKDKKKAGGKWEHMAAYELAYAKNDIAEGSALADLLHEKFLASLTPEQYKMYTAVNGLHGMASDIIPPAPEHPADAEWKYGYWTLAKVRERVNEVKVALLGFDPTMQRQCRAALIGKIEAQEKAAGAGK
jgi:hypothetical protein